MEINGVESDNEDIYYSSKFILEQIENKFGECYSNEFVKELRDTVDTVYLAYNKFSLYNDNEFSFAYLEEDFTNFIEKAEKFNDIMFLYGGRDWQIESLNEKIAEGAFEKKESLTAKR